MLQKRARVLVSGSLRPTFETKQAFMAERAGSDRSGPSSFLRGAQRCRWNKNKWRAEPSVRSRTRMRPTRSSLEKVVGLYADGHQDKSELFKTLGDLPRLKPQAPNPANCEQEPIKHPRPDSRLSLTALWNTKNCLMLENELRLPPDDQWQAPSGTI